MEVPKYVVPKSEVPVILYSTYLPTSGQDDDFLDILAQLKADIDNNIDKSMAIIIGADTNVSKKSTSRRYSAMQQFLESLSLESILDHQLPTFHHNNQSSESQIDHVYFSIPEKSRIRIKLKTQLCLKENPSNLSSHDVIVGEIVLPVDDQDNSEDKDFSSSYTPFLVQKPTWNGPGRERYQEETAKVLQDLSQAYTGAEFIPVLCEMFSRALVICAEKSFESRQQTKKKTKKKEYPYFSKLKSTMKLMQNIKRASLNGGRQDDLQINPIQPRHKFYTPEDNYRRRQEKKTTTNQLNLPMT